MTGAPLTTLVMGGARSGKSQVAEDLALAATANDAKTVYLATAQALDNEMEARIRAHRRRRDDRWETLEEPLAIAAALKTHGAPDRAVLIDCLTLWLSNLMADGRDVTAETDAFIAALNCCAGPVVLVSNEVGQGIVPDNPPARAFRDFAGELNRRCAAVCDRVLFVTAGLTQNLKEPS